MLSIGTYKYSKLRWKLFFLYAAFAFTAFKPVGAGMEGNEYQIKAMFVFNFTKYVEWPKSVAGDAFVIGIIGESEIAVPMELIAQQKKVGDKKIVIKKLDPDGEDYCQIIIVPRSRSNKLEQIEKKYAGKGVLIISDEAPRSAAINLVTLDNKIRFEVNQAMVKNGGVKLSGQLLALAIAVH